MNSKVLGSVAATAIAGLLTASSALAAGDKKADAPKGDAKTYCQNNSCKGKSACKGHENNSCKGKNTCKGHGFLDAKDEAACSKAGGKWHKG